jgi:O-antigen/teichoic acid export membrane protein
MKLLKNISKVSIITGFASLSFFATNIILARKLDISDFGHFSLIRSLIMLLPILIYFGFSNSIIRFSKSNDLSKFNIFEPIKQVSLWSVLIAIFVVGFVKQFYSLGMLDFFVLLGASWVLGRLWIVNSLLRINENYSTAQLVPFAWKFILLFIIIILLFIDWISLESTLLVLFISFFFSYFYGIAKEKQYKCGTKKISIKRIYLTGLSFFMVNILSLFMSQFDKLSIAKIFDSESVAIYSGVSLISLTTFNLLGTSIGYVLMPHLSKGKRISKLEFILYTVITPLVIFAILFNYGEFANNLFYDNKYSNYPIIFQLTLILAVLQYYNNLIQFSMGGIGTNKDVLKYLFVIVFSIIIMFIAYFIIEQYFDIQYDKLVRLIFAILIGWVIRVLFGGWLLINKLLKVRVQ